MKIVIVGGGITGSVVAAHCAGLGHSVRLFERSVKLGGVMADIVIDDTPYLNGCHYFDRGTPWFEQLRDQLPSPFHEFQHDYGAVTDFDGNLLIDHDVAQPCFAGKVRNVRSGKQPAISVRDRLSVFPPDVESFLSTWAEKFGTLQQLHQSCTEPMQIARICFPEDSKTALNLKKNSAVADSCLAVARSVLHPDVPLPKAVLPVGGYNRFFEGIHQHLAELGVEVRLNSIVAPMGRSPEDFYIQANGQKLEADLTIWCCNPTGLLLKTGIGRLDAPVSRMFGMVGDLKGAEFENPAYYHVFSNTYPFIRYFFYDKSSPKIIVEGFDGGQSDSLLYDQFFEFAKKIELKGQFNPLRVERQKRYSFHTVEDRKKFAEFGRVAKQFKIIPGGWQHYSRDAKIDGIISALKVWK